MEVKSAILIAHVMAVISGVGGAVMLDVYLFRHLRGSRLSATDIAISRFLALFVRLGLIMLWVTGIGLMAAAPEGPVSVFAIPKVQAKLVVVVVLTLNALFIETLALPLLIRNQGEHLFDGVSESRKTAIIGCGVISALSWTTPFLLGMARELNMIPAVYILAAYGSALLLGLLVAQVGARIIYRPQAAAQPVAARPRAEDVKERSASENYHADARARIASAFLTGRIPSSDIIDIKQQPRHREQALAS